MTDEQMRREALKRIALTPDGRLLHLQLQLVLMEMPHAQADASALLKYDGRRRFAAEMKAVMDESIAENPSDRSADATVDRPIVVAPRTGGVIERAPAGARRRVPEQPA
jgi:hypothetical protein